MLVNAIASICIVPFTSSISYIPWYIITWYQCMSHCGIYIASTNACHDGIASVC